MLVEEAMKTDVITVNKETTIQEAIELLEKHKIRHIPVVEQDHTLIGIVSDRDIRDARPSIFHKHLDDDQFLQEPVSKIMKSPVHTAHPFDCIDEAAVILYEKDIGSLPVVTDDDKLEGILTETDVLHTLIKLTGAHQPSSRIEVVVPNISGQLANIANILKEHDVNVTSVLVYPTKDTKNKTLTFRVQTMDPRQIISEIKKKGYEVSWPALPRWSYDE